jgi:hypothetical protein
LHLVQDSNQWRAVVNSVMNLRVYKRREISWLAEWLLASQEGLCSVEYVLGYEPVKIFCVHGSETLGSIKGG